MPRTPCRRQLRSGRRVLRIRAELKCQVQATPPPSHPFLLLPLSLGASGQGGATQESDGKSSRPLIDNAAGKFTRFSADPSGGRFARGRPVWFGEHAVADPQPGAQGRAAPRVALLAGAPFPVEDATALSGVRGTGGSCCRESASLERKFSFDSEGDKGTIHDAGSPGCPGVQSQPSSAGVARDPGRQAVCPR